MRTLLERRPFDVTGFVLCGFACSSLIVATEHLGSADSSPLMLTAGLVIGVVATALAVWHLRRARALLVSLVPLRIRTLGVAVGDGSIYRISIGAVPFLLSLMLQTSFGFSAFVSGLLTLSARAV